MDWEQLREKTLGEVTTSLVTSGGGVAGGFIGAAFVGRQIENAIKPGVATTSPIADKVVAWSANNVPKLAIWYLTRGYALEPGETVTPTKEVVSDARKAMAGSIVFDTLMRLANSGVNPASATVWGWQVLGEQQKSSQGDVQRLIQENSALRAELNKALQRLAAPAVPPAPPQVASPTPPMVQTPLQVQPAQAQAPPVVRYQPASQPMVKYQAPPNVNVAPIRYQAPPNVQVAPVQRAEPKAAAQPVPPAVSERERRYGFMQYEQTPPSVQERQKEFGFMSDRKEKDIAAMFGML